jgi:hypothetical protein
MGAPAAAQAALPVHLEQTPALPFHSLSLSLSLSLSIFLSLFLSLCGSLCAHPSLALGTCGNAALSAMVVEDVPVAAPSEALAPLRGYRQLWRRYHGYSFSVDTTLDQWQVVGRQARKNFSTERLATAVVCPGVRACVRVCAPRWRAEETAMEELLDFSRPLNVELLDAMQQRVGHQRTPNNEVRDNDGGRRGPPGATLTPACASVCSAPTLPGCSWRLAATPTRGHASTLSSPATPLSTPRCGVSYPPDPYMGGCEHTEHTHGRPLGVGRCSVLWAQDPVGHDQGALERDAA